jgi:hypothetical protein
MGFGFNNMRIQHWLLSRNAMLTNVYVEIIIVDAINEWTKIRTVFLAGY